MQSVTVTGAHIRVYINGKVYNETQSVTYTLDNGAEEIYGVDSIYPQEIIVKRSTVNGQVSGLVIKQSGGLQSRGIRSLAADILKHPYVSIRIQNRQTGEDLLLCNKCIIASETLTASAKGTVKLSFNFRGIIPLQPLDRV